MRILVVDDEEANLTLLGSALQHAGFSDVHTLSDARETQSALTRLRPDLLLLDLHMPHASGLQVLESLRSELPDDELFPVLMLTADARPEVKREALAKGVTDFLTKPLDLQEVALRVTNHLRARQLDQANRAERRRALAAERRYRDLFESVPVGVCRVTPAGAIATANPALAHILGSGTPEGLPGVPFETLLVHDPVSRLLRTDRDVLEAEAYLHHASGDVTVALLNVRRSLAPSGGVRHWDVSVQDITVKKRIELELKARQEQLQRMNVELERLVNYDPLTRLPNRITYGARLEDAVARAQEHGSITGLLYLDLDGFKEVNDALGHAYGDTLLQAVAKRLTSIVRTDDTVSRVQPPEEPTSYANVRFEPRVNNDTVCRIGGDEFAVILADLHDPGGANAVANRAIAGLSRPYQIGGREIHVSCSIGIALAPHDADSAEDLTRCAATALQDAKTHGGRGSRFFTRAMNEHVRLRAELRDAIRESLRHDDFYVDYQPRVDLRSGAVTSVEALARWRHPKRGVVPPATFIPVAEESDLIHALGALVLRRACRQAKAWQEQGLNLRVAVNLSVRQLNQPGVVDEILGVLREFDLDGRWLELEITESALVDNSDATIEKLTALTDAGITLSIDDFGIGYSSLSYLKLLPVSSLKIDRSFITGLPSDRPEHDEAIVRAIIALAKSLGLTVIGEGIETPEQHRLLEALQCDAAQGYLFSKPVSPDAVAAFARTRRPPAARPARTRP